jgi:hypothetical protein
MEPRSGGPADEPGQILQTWDKQRVEALVAELDRLVPRQGALVWSDHLDPVHDDPAFRANRLGFVRYGIELAKAGLVSRPEGPVEVPLDYLTPSPYDPPARQFERVERYERPAFKHVSWMEVLPAVLVPPAMFLGILLMAVGLGTVIGWLR